MEKRIASTSNSISRENISHPSSSFIKYKTLETTLMAKVTSRRLTLVNDTTLDLLSSKETK